MAVAELKFPEIKNYVGGKFIDSNETKIDVISPLDGSLLSRVPVSGYEALDQAVQSALKAFPTWSATPIKERVQILFNYRNLLQQYREELTELIHLENGKIKSTHPNDSTPENDSWNQLRNEIHFEFHISR